MTEPDDQAAAAAATRAAGYLAHVTTSEPGITAGVAALILMAEARDSLDYGEPVYAEALTALVMRLAVDYRAHVIAAADQ